jgi:hypothetical protein
MKNRTTFNPKRRIRGYVEQIWIDELLLSIKYGGGNPEHKRSKQSPDVESFSARPYKSQCHEAKVYSLSEAQTLLLEGVRLGLISQQTRGTFPQNVWAVTPEGVPLEGQLENQVQATYHGYPMPSSDPLASEVLSLWRKKKND